MKAIQKVNVAALGIEVVLTRDAGADWWDPDNEGLCVWAAYQPRGAANLAASYVDLSGNGNNCGPGVAPNWDAVNGWRFDGATHWLDTLFQPQNDQSQSMIAQYTNFVFGGAHECICGCVGADAFSIDLAVWAVGAHRYNNGGFAHIAAAVPAGGNVCVAGNQGYLNGAPDGGLIPGYGGALNMNTYIGAANTWGAASRFCQVNVQAFALYDCTLTAAQVAAVATAMAAI